MPETTIAKNLDYLRFDAFSLKDLIIQKLGENPHFTDFVFEDSNLMPIIDIFSNTYAMLMYYLNHGAAEAMFSDSQLYENINRIVKIFGYNPRGFSTAMVDAQVYGYPNSNSRILPKYSYVPIAGSDANGKSMYYSTVDYYYIYPDSHTIKNNIIMYNGIWRLYNRTFVANGQPFETIFLEDLYSDSDENKYTPLKFIDVMVKRQTTSGHEWIKFSPVESGLFLNQASQKVYKPTDKIFNVRLNEDKSISLQFGDGINGERLQSGDELYIVYLDSNGKYGEIGVGGISESSSSGNIRYGIAGMDSATFNEIIADEAVLLVTSSDLSTMYIENTVASTKTQEEETVDEIKTNAPKWFSSGGILRSIEDFTQYIVQHYNANIDSVKVMNNWGYISSLYRWLYNLEISTGTTYLTPELKTKYDYPWADSCDFNNIYMFIQFKTATSITKNDIHAAIQPLKPMTSEIVFVDPLEIYFAPNAYDNSYDITDWDPNIENYIEILVDENSLVSPEIVHSRVTNEIVNFFSAENQEIGNTLDFNELSAKIQSIGGVQRIRTIFIDPTLEHPNIIFNGLRFAAWTRKIVNGADKTYITGTYKLEDFHFPVLLDSEDLSTKIKVVTKSTYQLATPEF